MEGTRPVLAEVQALVTKTTFNVPRRAADGFDFNRAVLLMAVAEKRAGMKLSAFDAYINVIGGLRLDEPGADLPVALAIASSYRDGAIADDLVAIGEVGLTGEIRARIPPGAAAGGGITAGLQEVHHSQKRLGKNGNSGGTDSLPGAKSERGY